MGTITWEDFAHGARHILAVSDSIGDGWCLRGSLEHCGGYLAKRMDFPAAVPLPAIEVLSTEDDATIDHGSAEDPCSIDPDPSLQPICREFHVLYNLAHAVPTLFLRAWRPDGRCLESEELWREFTAAAELAPDQIERLRTLSQQEHPFLGEPWYNLHPCRTADLMDMVGRDDVDGVDAKFEPTGSRDDVQSSIVSLSAMELVRAFTTRQPVVGTTVGTTLQRNITIYVLVAGIAGGLLLILAILFLCKYCSRLRSRSSGGNIASSIISSKNAGWSAGLNHCHLAANNQPAGDSNHAKDPLDSLTVRDSVGTTYNSGRATEVSVAITNAGAVAKFQHRLTSNNKSAASSTTPNQTTLSPSVNPPGPLGALHQHMDTTNSQSILKDSDSYVIQVEPMRVMAASPSSILGGADSWASDESSTAHRMTINAEMESWTRHVHQQETITDNSGGSGDEVHVSPVSVPANRRSLRHAASHPSSYDDGSSASSAVSKRRLDWRNSHRNYRSAPTTAASRDSYALNYETRRALRDYHQHSIEASAVASNRRMLPKRGGSMRETVLASSQDASSTTSSITAAELTGATSCIPPTVVAQQHSRCQMMASPATKRWRCHTVDCPCSNNVTAINKDLMMEGALTTHRHSFPSSGELASPTSSASNRRHYQRSEDQHYGGRTKEAFYDGYLDRSESLDWAEFQARSKPTIKRDEVASVIDDVDGTAGQLQSASAGPAPRITIRYNDPGSLESVNEDNLFFCLEAGSKNEFRQRLEKTIHAQYRQVWELRANLEEHNEVYEPSSPEPEAIPIPGISDLESFDSNPESLPCEDEEEDLRHTAYSGMSPSPLQDVSCETKTSSSTMLLPVAHTGSWKRQSYRSIAINSRLRGPTVPQSPQQPQSSFDSIDTIETSSTEASRMDHVTTSFESSATDSTNGPEATIQPSVSHHRMLTLRNDSGYRSLESAAVPAPRLTKALATALSLSEDDASSDQKTGGSSSCQCQNQVLHDEKCERYKPVVFARCTRYGMKTRSSSTSTPHPSAPVTGWRHQQRIQQHQSQQFLTRDYSIDERTDAIFREFSRCDPVYDGSKNVGGSRGELRTTGFSHRTRWINQHQRHDNQHQHQHRFLSFQDASSSHPLVTDASDSLLQHCSLQE